VVLDFWATWCGPCKKALPAIQKLHERFRERPVSVLGISAWEDPARGSVDPVEVMKKNGCDYPLLLQGDKVAQTYKVSSLPTACVIDAQGRIAFWHPGFDEDLEAVLARAVEAALAKAK